MLTVYELRTRLCLDGATAIAKPRERQMGRLANPEKRAIALSYFMGFLWYL